jgi:hypothetical protein
MVSVLIRTYNGTLLKELVALIHKNLIMIKFN